MPTKYSTESTEFHKKEVERLSSQNTDLFSRNSKLETEVSTLKKENKEKIEQLENQVNTLLRILDRVMKRVEDDSYPYYTSKSL